MISVQKLRTEFSYDALTGAITRLVASSNAIKAGSQTSANSSSCGYCRVWVDGKSIKAHRLAWALHYGEWPSAQIDHINGNRSDNRLCNLREATQQQQNANASVRQDNKARLRGVSFHKASKKFTARLFVSGMLVKATYHDTAEEAAMAYRSAHDAHFGEFSFFKSRVAD